MDEIGARPPYVAGMAHISHYAAFWHSIRRSMLALALGLAAASSFATDAHFEDASALLAPLQDQRSYGATWADIDGDGWPDLFLTNHNRHPPYVLLNGGGTSFTEISASSSLSVMTDYHACRWADYDRDGDWDVYCATGGSASSRLMRNRGDGTFDDVARDAGVDFPRASGRSATWLDIDGDGNLDLFVAAAPSDETKPKSKLFRNNGEKFTDITSDAGIALQQRVTLSAAIDLDNDGHVDLLLYYNGDSGGPCSWCWVFLRNDGNGMFQTIAAGTRGLSFNGYPGTLALGDFNNDGYLDAFIGNRNPEYAVTAKLAVKNPNQTSPTV